MYVHRHEVLSKQLCQSFESNIPYCGVLTVRVDMVPRDPMYYRSYALDVPEASSELKHYRVLVGLDNLGRPDLLITTDSSQNTHHS